MLERGAFELVVPVQLDAAGRAVAHRERTVVRGRGRREEILPRELMHARQRAVRALVADGDEPLLDRDALEPVPADGDLDAVDSAPPRVERDVTRRLLLGHLG